MTTQNAESILGPKEKQCVNFDIWQMFVVRNKINISKYQSRISSYLVMQNKLELSQQPTEQLDIPSICGGFCWVLVYEFQPKKRCVPNQILDEVERSPIDMEKNGRDQWSSEKRDF